MFVQVFTSLLSDLNTACQARISQLRMDAVDTLDKKLGVSLDDLIKQQQAQKRQGGTGSGRKVCSARRDKCRYRLVPASALTAPGCWFLHCSRSCSCASRVASAFERFLLLSRSKSEASLHAKGSVARAPSLSKLAAALTASKSHGGCDSRSVEWISTTGQSSSSDLSQGTDICTGM